MYSSRIVKKLPTFARTAIALAVGLALLWAFYLGVVLNIPYDADTGGLMLMARTAADGNVLLKGWVVPTNYYLTTELPFYLAGIFILGFTWKVIHVVTALHYAAIALLAIFLSTRGEVRASAFHRLLIPLALTAYLAAWAYGSLYLSTGHLVCFAYSLVCLLCIQRAEGTGNRIYYLIYASFLALALIGDIFALYLIAIPVALVCLIRLLARGPRTSALSLLLATLSAVGFFRLVMLVLRSLGAAGWPVPPVEFASLPLLVAKVQGLPGVVLDLFSVELTGQTLNPYGLAIAVVRLSGLILFALILFRVLIQLPRRSLYVQVVMASIAIDFASNLVSSRESISRYLLPSLIFGIPLVSQVVYESAAFRARRGLVASYFLILLLSLTPPLSYAKPASMWDRIAKDILQLHLTSGYGPAWGANSITVATAGKATVRPVALQDGGLIAPYVCGMSDPGWYGSYADFLVLNTDGTSALQPSREQVVRSFGSPAGVYSLGSYGDLLVWNHDITPQLSRPDECAWAP